MAGPTPIVVFGAEGRVGRMILRLAEDDPEHYFIVGAVERRGHPRLGMGLLASEGAPPGLRLADRPPEGAARETVAIHFSSPEATVEHIAWSARGGHGAVVGTTGLSGEQRARIEDAARHAPILITPNTSRGVNVLFHLAREAARLLGEDYDVEIVEMHHHHKKDAPSGTARGLAEAVLAARGGDYARDTRHGRQGLSGERTRGEIGMHALRGGDVVGDHTLILAGVGERIELTHRAQARETFAHGALRAAAWLSGRPPGLYSMKDVLGIQG